METASWSQICIRVDGMTCNSCVKCIEDCLSPLSNAEIRLIKVSLEQKQALIEFDANRTSPTALAERISEMGFDAAIIEDSFAVSNASFHPLDQSLNNSAQSSKPVISRVLIGVDGMTCQSCVQCIDAGLSRLAGVTRVRTSLEQRHTIVYFDPSLVSVAKLAEAIDDMGFTTTAPTSLPPRLAASRAEPDLMRFTPDHTDHNEPKDHPDHTPSSSDFHVATISLGTLTIALPAPAAALAVPAASTSASASSAESALRQAPGVVSLERTADRSLVISFDPSLITADELRHLIATHIPPGTAFDLFIPTDY